jgi:hypothetical protein
VGINAGRVIHIEIYVVIVYMGGEGTKYGSETRIDVTGVTPAN